MDKRESAERGLTRRGSRLRVADWPGLRRTVRCPTLACLSDGNKVDGAVFKMFLRLLPWLGVLGRSGRPTLIAPQWAGSSSPRVRSRPRARSGYVDTPLPSAELASFMQARERGLFLVLARLLSRS